MSCYQGYCSMLKSRIVNKMKAIANQRLKSKHKTKQIYSVIQGGSNMTRTDLCVNKPHCTAAVRP